MKSNLKMWFCIVLFNLVLVAFLGTILRYKIAFSLPFLDQKHLLHAHSHFAFSGWISQALMVLIVNFLAQRGVRKAFEKYSYLLWLNLIAAYGMLICFPIQGYGMFSISFSTLSIFTAYIFAFQVWKDIKVNSIKEIAGFWFKAALVFNAVSSIGAFALAYLMANKIVHQNWYLIAVYFFLHFQYNGWFFFACGGLWFSKMKDMNINFQNEKRLFWIFACTCIPCFLLSILWINMQSWIFLLVVISAAFQVIALFMLLKASVLNLKKIKSLLSRLSVNLLALSLLALSIKFLLQLFSTIPALNQLAYGFRPIVIGYLHLVLLGFVSLSILAFAIAGDFLNYNLILIRSSLLFVSGILLNEILLMLQGTAAMQNISISFINELLLLTAFFLLSGAVGLFLSQQKSATRVKY
jgi:hypothetical protein